MALPEERLLEIEPVGRAPVRLSAGRLPPAPRAVGRAGAPRRARARARRVPQRASAAGRPFEIHFTGLHRDHRDLPAPGEPRRPGGRRARLGGPLRGLHRGPRRSAGSLEPTLRSTAGEPAPHARRGVVRRAGGRPRARTAPRSRSATAASPRCCGSTSRCEPGTPLARAAPRSCAAGLRRAAASPSSSAGCSPTRRATRSPSSRTRTACCAATRGRCATSYGAVVGRIVTRRGRHLVVADAAPAHPRAEDGEHGPARRRRGARLQQPARHHARLRLAAARADAGRRPAARGAGPDRPVGRARLAASPRRCSRSAAARASSACR